MITSVVTQPASPQPASSTSNTASVLFSVQGESASAARQQLAVAVTATGAPAPYSPKTAPQRQPTIPGRAAPEALSSQPSILPDLEVFQAPRAVPMPVAAPVAQPLPALTTQQATPFIAQAAAQQMSAEVAPSLPEEPRPIQLRRMATLPSKKPGVGNSSGLNAYGVALDRNMAMSFPSIIEKFL